MNEIGFIIILLALALGIPAGYGLTYLIAWLIVDYQDRNEKMRRRMGYLDYLRYRRKKRRRLIFYIGFFAIMQIPAIMYYFHVYATIP